MAGQLMLVNPRKRKRRRNPKAARAPGAPRRKPKYKATTRAKRAARRFGKTARRSTKRAARSVGKFFSKVRRGARRSKRKPQSMKQLLTNPGGFVRTTVLPAAIGAGGAIALDMAYAYLPIPANIKSGPLAPLVKIGAISLIGAGAVHFAPQKSVRMIQASVAAGVTIIAYGWLKAKIQQAVPNVRLGEFLEDDNGCPIPGVTPLSYWQAGQFLPGGMSEYVSEYVSGDDDMSGVPGYVLDDDDVDLVS